MIVRLSALADRDLKAIAAYIAEDDPGAARNLLMRINERVAQLSRFPELGRRRLDIAIDVRGLLIPPYLAVYRINPDAVVVLRVLHTSRDLNNAPLR